MTDDGPSNTEFGPDLPGRKNGKFAKGNKAGKGRIPGSKNKITRLMQDAIMGSMERRGDAINEAGKSDQKGLEAFIDTLPTDLFVTQLVSKLLPRHIDSESEDLAGAKINIVLFKKPKAKKPKELPQE